MFVSYQPVGIGSPCNFNCVACGCQKEPPEHLTTEELKRRLLTIPESENVEFIGGEFFIRKDAAAIVQFASERFGSVKYNTNGAVFSYRNVLDTVCENGLNIIFLKFFSTNPEIHAAVTKTDTLKYVVQGFENLATRQRQACQPFVDKWECGFFLAVDVVVHSLTLPALEQTARYLSAKEIPRLIINFNHSDCASDDALAIARRCLDEAAGNGTWAVATGLPVCAMRGYEEFCGDVFRLQRFIPGHVFIPGVCERCLLFSTCGGIAPAIADKRQWAPVTPGSGIRNLDDIIHFHSHIPERLPLFQSGTWQ